MALPPIQRRGIILPSICYIYEGKSNLLKLVTVRILAVTGFIRDTSLDVAFSQLLGLYKVSRYVYTVK